MAFSRWDDKPLIMTSLYRGLSEIVRFDIDPSRVTRVLAGTRIKTREEMVFRIVGGHDVFLHQRDMKKLKEPLRSRAAAVACYFWDKGIIDQLNLLPRVDNRFSENYNGMPETFYEVDNFPRVDRFYRIIYDTTILEP